MQCFNLAFLSICMFYFSRRQGFKARVKTFLRMVRTFHLMPKPMKLVDSSWRRSSKTNEIGYPCQRAEKIRSMEKEGKSIGHSMWKPSWRCDSGTQTQWVEWLSSRYVLRKKTGGRTEVVIVEFWIKRRTVSVSEYVAGLKPVGIESKGICFFL